MSILGRRLPNSGTFVAMRGGRFCLELMVRYLPGEAVFSCVAEGNIFIYVNVLFCRSCAGNLNI